MKATTLIAASTSNDTFAIADYTSELAAELEALCDGSTEANGTHEFWGDDPGDENAMMWRVHLMVHELVGQRVEAGSPGTDYHDSGICHGVIGDVADVAWDSGVRTSVPADCLSLESD